MLHIRVDSQHYVEFKKVLPDTPKLICFEKGKETGKQHYHIILKEGNGETIRKRWVRTKHYMDYSKSHNRDNSYAIQKVKKPEEMISYVLKDGDIVENTLEVDPNQYIWKNKKEFKKAQSMYDKIIIWLLQSEFSSYLICEDFTRLCKAIIVWYIKELKSIPGKYQIQTVARTVLAQYLVKATNNTDKEIWKIAEQIYDRTID